MRIVLSGLAAFAVMFAAGGVWNAALMGGFYTANAPSNARLPEEQSMVFLALAYLFLAGFMSFLFSQSFSERPSVAAGFQFGGLFGVIATLPLYLILYAVWDISLKAALVDTAWHLAEQGIGGAVLALTMFGRQQQGGESNG